MTVTLTVLAAAVLVLMLLAAGAWIAVRERTAGRDAKIARDLEVFHNAQKRQHEVLVDSGADPPDDFGDRLRESRRF